MGGEETFVEEIFLSSEIICLWSNQFLITGQNGHIVYRKNCKSMNNKLVTIGGIGIENHIRSIGKFEVRYSETKTFTELRQAFNYYNQLDYPASLFDVTTAPLCIEMKTFSEFELPPQK